MPVGFPGDSPTPVGRPRTAKAKHTFPSPVAPRGTRVKNERILRLKDELNIQLELVVDARVKLERELRGVGKTPEMKTLSWDFVKRLKELTACFNSLTSSRIALDTAEKKLDKDLTPGEERDAVADFILALPTEERREMIKYLAAEHSRLGGHQLSLFQEPLSEAKA